MRINQLDPPKNTYGPPIGGPYFASIYLLQSQITITYLSYKCQAYCNCNCNCLLRIAVV